MLINNQPVSGYSYGWARRPEGLRRFSAGGIRKTRYKNCSMRIYRKVLRRESSKSLQPSLTSISSTNISTKSTSSSNSTCSTDIIAHSDFNYDSYPSRTSPIKTRIITKHEKTLDDLIFLTDALDIGKFSLV